MVLTLDTVRRAHGEHKVSFVVSLSFEDATHRRLSPFPLLFLSLYVHPLSIWPPSLTLSRPSSHRRRSFYPLPVSRSTFFFFLFFFFYVFFFPTHRSFRAFV